MSRRPLILGLDNPHGAGEALDPRSPPGHAGRRLFELSGIELDEYLEAFERRNVCDVDRVYPYYGSAAFGDRTVVALGNAAWMKIHLPAAGFFSSFELGNSRFIKIPHPSGRCRFYNDPANRARVRRLLRRVARCR